ncbi:OLC1v1031765C1 [Oldenlandia corymbosa var. corymbosa]|uniref:OLC1v1031765C1 n=1 Tax=Oldenlandia corymbosa var. corymbosa TaxID=529605 RepID=A0AAV1CJB3_OLDCO|nr:OLC1v1031765C1 [Oldenlandia corymbosa var. corymbosa]
MSSTVIPCIVSALDAVQSEIANDPPVDDESRMLKRLKQILNLWLRNIKTFAVLSNKKLGNDATLASLLLRIEHVVRKILQQIPIFAVPRWSSSFEVPQRRSCEEQTKLHDSIASEFLKDDKSLQEEIRNCYVAMQQSSTCLTTTDLSEIVRCILETLLDFHSVILGQIISPHLFEEHTSMEAYVKALKDHIAFLQRITVSKMLQMINPVDPKVFDTYTHALSSSRLPSLSIPLTTQCDAYDDDATIPTLITFLDSLISSLWRLLRFDSCRLAFVKHHLQELYGGLRSLRAILKHLKKKKPNNNSIQQQIAAVVCDAGILIFSLYQNHSQVDFSRLLNLLHIIMAKQLDFSDTIFLRLVEVTNFGGYPNATGHL